MPGPAPRRPRPSRPAALGVPVPAPRRPRPSRPAALGVPGPAPRRPRPSRPAALGVPGPAPRRPRPSRPAALGVPGPAPRRPRPSRPAALGVPGPAPRRPRPSRPAALGVPGPAPRRPRPSRPAALGVPGPAPRRPRPSRPAALGVPGPAPRRPRPSRPAALGVPGPAPRRPRPSRPAALGVPGPAPRRPRPSRPGSPRGAGSRAKATPSEPAGSPRGAGSRAKATPSEPAGSPRGRSRRLVASVVVGAILGGALLVAVAAAVGTPTTSQTPSPIAPTAQTGQNLGTGHATTSTPPSASTAATTVAPAASSGTPVPTVRVLNDIVVPEGVVATIEPGYLCPGDFIVDGLVRYDDDSNTGMYIVTTGEVRFQNLNGNVTCIADTPANEDQIRSQVGDGGKRVDRIVVPSNVTQSALGIAAAGPSRLGAGWFFSLALQDSGRVIAWGDNSQGQLDLPVRPLPCGRGCCRCRPQPCTSLRWACRGMGQRLQGQTRCRQAYPASSRLRLAATTALPCATTALSWRGDNANGECDVPASLTNVKAIAAGFGFSVALQTNGTVVAWGSSIYGPARVERRHRHQGDRRRIRYGIRDWQRRLSCCLGFLASQVPAGVAGVAEITGGQRHIVALLVTGRVASWGLDDAQGQLDVPASLSNVTAIAAGGYHSLAMTASGDVVAWGDVGPPG